MTRVMRDRAIVAALRGGESRVALAARYGLTARRISQIGNAGGVWAGCRPIDALQRRGGRGRDPVLAALGDQLPTYAKARRYFGAAEARRMFGVSA